MPELPKGSLTQLIGWESSIPPAILAFVTTRPTCRRSSLHCMARLKREDEVPR